MKNSTCMSSYTHLLPNGYKAVINSWLDEDTPTFDYGGYVVGDTIQEAILFCKSSGILAGVPFFEQVFHQLGCQVEWFIREGEFIEATSKVKVAKVTGPARKILLGERVALNIMARASGVASRARRLVALAQANEWHGCIAASRKTTPGFRLIEKYAVLVGGADTHRMDLSSMIMLKDNHIWATGSITNAVKQARQVGGFALKIEVECQSEHEADEAIQAGADIVMLDNFNGPSLRIAAKNLKERWAGQYFFLVEGSGGLTEEIVAAYFCPHVDVLSFGSLTQSVPHVDFSLKIQQK